MIWSTLEFPSFNFNSILDGFCILKGMSYMMPLSRHVLSLQTGLHRLFILGTVILPTMVTICADGTYMTPTTIFKGVHFNSAWAEALKDSKLKLKHVIFTIFCFI